MVSDSKVPCCPANQWKPVPERVRIVSFLFYVRWPSHPSVFSGSGRAARFGWCGNKRLQKERTKKAKRPFAWERKYFILSPQKVCLVGWKWWNARLCHATCLWATFFDSTMSTSALLAGSGEPCTKICWRTLNATRCMSSRSWWTMQMHRGARNNNLD